MSSISIRPGNDGIVDIPGVNVSSVLYIKGKKFQEYLDEVGSGLTAPELAEVKSLLEYLDITGLNSAWTVTNSNINETLRSAITALQTKTANLDTTGLTSPSILTDANKNSALKTAIDTLITDLTALAVRVSTEETNVDNLQTKTANLDTTGLTSPSVLTDANKNSVLKTAIDALANTPGDVTALAGRVTTAEGDIDALENRATSLEGRATSLEGRATAVEGRATTLEGKTRFTTVSNTYFDNNSGTAQPFGIPFGDYDGSTYPIGSFKMEVGPTLVSGNGKSYFEITHKNLVQNPNFPAGDITQVQFSDLLRCAGIRSYYRKGATPGIYNLSNETFLQHTDESGDGRVTVKAKRIRIYPPDTNSIVEIGRFTGGWSNPDIRIGGAGNQINIGSMENDSLDQGVGDVATKTRIYIGRRPDPITEGNVGDVLNSQLILRGDVWTGNLNWKNLSITSAINAQSIYAALNATSLPLYMLQTALTGGIFSKSDVVVMKAGLAGLVKRGDIETTNELSIDKLSIINQTIGNITPGVTFFFAQQNYSCTHLIGDNKTSVFQGDIIFKNHNSLVAAFDPVTEDNDKCNVLSIKGNSGILLHQGASSNNESLDIFNSKSGPIRLFIGADGTRAGTTHGGAYIMRYLESFGNNLVATGETKVILGSRIGIDSALASEAYQGDGFGQGKVATDAQLVIEPSTKVDTTRRQGINVRHKTIVNNLPVYTQSIINSDSISTPSVETQSLAITANYTGSTTARLYKDSNNALYWNGALVTPAEAQTLGAVMTLGNTASTTLNMNSNGITNVASIQGWNVKDITAGTNITATAASGNYTIANAAPVQNIISSTNIGVAIASNTATLTNLAPVQNVVAGSGGISIDYNGTTATINHIGIGGIGGGGGSQTIHDLNALEEVGAFRQPESWAKNWNITDNVVSIHFDMYCSVDGRIIASASAGTGGDGPVRYSLNYGTSWASGNTNVNWRSITGTSSGSKLFATGYLSANPNTYVYYTSTTQGATWTSHNINSVTNSSPSPLLTRIRSSGDGTHLIMCDESPYSTEENGPHVSRIFVSANGGNSWTAKLLSIYWIGGFSLSCAMSRSGRYQYVVSRTSYASFIHRSDDFGVTWSFMFSDQAFVGSDAGMFIRIECDSTGRYVYATRRRQDGSVYNLPMYQSSDFGANWSASSLNVAMLDVWVSATGQHVCAVSTPSNLFAGSSLYYSSDYGRTYGETVVGTSFRCLVGSGDGSTLVLGSLNNTEFGVVCDGKIRVARQIPLEIVTTGLNENAMINGIMNLTPNQQLWARGEGYETGANGNYLCSFNGAPRINLSEYNIGYKIEFYWAPGYLVPAQFNHLGINNYTAAQSGYNQGSNGGYTSTTNMEFLHTPSSVDNKASFIGRSFCGYQQNISSTGLQYRHSSILTGTLSLNHRPENATAFGGLPASSGTLTTNDWGVFSKVLKNEFLCDNFTCVTANSNYQYDWGIVAPANIDYPFSYVTVRGNSVWDMTYGGIYYASGADSIQNGVFRLFIRNADNLGGFGGIDSTPTNRPRNAYMKYQIYRIRK